MRAKRIIVAALAAALAFFQPVAFAQSLLGFPPGTFSLYPPVSGGVTAVAIDNSANVHNTAGGTTSVNISSFTVGTGSHRYLAIEIVAATAYSTDTISCSWNSGVAQNLSTTPVSISASKKTVVMGLVNPNSGTGTVTCSWDVTYQADMYIEAVSFTGVNQSTPVTAATPTTGTGSPASISIPVSSANDMAVDIAHDTSNDNLTAPTQTSIWNLGYGGSSHGTGASSVSFSWTVQFGGDTWEELGLDMVAG